MLLQSAATEAAKIADGALDVLIYNAARLNGEFVLCGLLDLYATLLCVSDTAIRG